VSKHPIRVFFVRCKLRNRMFGVRMHHAWPIKSGRNMSENKPTNK